MPPTSWLPISGYTGHRPGLKYDVGHSYDWVVRHLKQINGVQSARNHVVVTPHGQTVASSGGGSGGPTDVVDTSTLRPQFQPSSSRGSISGYTGFIPGRQNEVGLNYHSATSNFYTDLERQSLERRQAREQQQAVGEAGGGHTNLTPSPAPAATPAPSTAAQKDNKYSRYSAQKSPQTEVIPIPGYGGFVPRARTTNLGVGKPFSQFANEGFSAMHDQVNQYRHQQSSVTVTA